MDAAERAGPGLSRGHRIARLAIALAVGLGLAWYAWYRATDPGPAAERARQEAVVAAARDILYGYLGRDIGIVDPLSPDRRVGRAYLYPAGDGWEVSGHYRRGAGTSWRPFLMHLDAAARLRRLTLRDDHPELIRRAAEDPRLEVRRQESAG